MNVSLRSGYGPLLHLETAADAQCPHDNATTYPKDATIHSNSPMGSDIGEGVRWWRLGSELDAKTQAQIDRGKRIVEIFKQPQYNPIPVEVLVAVIWAVQNVKQAN